MLSPSSVYFHGRLPQIPGHPSPPLKWFFCHNNLSPRLIHPNALQTFPLEIFRYTSCHMFILNCSPIPYFIHQMTLLSLFSISANNTSMYSVLKYDFYSVPPSSNPKLNTFPIRMHHFIATLPYLTTAVVDSATESFLTILIKPCLVFQLILKIILHLCNDSF